MNDPYGWINFWSLYEQGLWEPGTKAFIKSVLSSGNLFVDIGAWIGPTALWALETGANVIAIEPDTIALPELYKKVPSAEIWAGVVSTQSGTVRLSKGSVFGDSTSYIGDSEDSYEVQAWTLEEVLRGRIPTLVKIDVEGYEMELCPIIVPWLKDHGVAMQISCHGALPDRELFSNYNTLIYPNHTWGDIQCRM